MKHTTRLFLPPALIAMFVLSACAPAVPSTTPAATPVSPAATASPEATASLPTPTPLPVQPEATATEIPLPIATSRGPDLEATDPTTVTLASGGLQLVEFFRFT